MITKFINNTHIIYQMMYFRKFKNQKHYILFCTLERLFLKSIISLFLAFNFLLTRHLNLLIIGTLKFSNFFNFQLLTLPSKESKSKNQPTTFGNPLFLIDTKINIIREDIFFLYKQGILRKNAKVYKPILCNKTIS